MSSKKASFEAKDPTRPADIPAGDPFVSHDPLQTPGEAVEFTLDDDNAPAGNDPSNTPLFESRELSNTDLNPEGIAVSEKASFYSRDPDLGGSGDSAESGTSKYTGVERRRENRRSGHDRRSDVRFDLDKNDRRQSEGRREGDQTPKYW